MKILFIFYDTIEKGIGKYHEGIATMAAVLKKAGHDVELYHIVEDISMEEVLEEYKQKYLDSDIIACSMTELSLDFYLECFSRLKKEYDVYTVCGGPVATLCPEDILASGTFDALCRGDGEESLLELCEVLSKDECPDDIEGFWFYNQGDFVKNPVRPVPKDLSAYPAPDRSIFDFSRIYEYKLGVLPVMAARGCPFNCSFCCNHALKEALPNKQNYIRYKDIDSFIDEIVYEIGNAGKHGFEIKRIHFSDDLLITNKKWFGEFSQRYKNEINLPYSCNCRFELLNDQMLQLLSESGCSTVHLGMETGDEELRKNVLNRHQANDMMIEHAALCHKWGIKFHLFTMVGIPEEDLSKALKTVKFSAKIQSDSMQVSVLYPFLNTQIYRDCMAKGYIKDRSVKNYMEGKTSLELPTMSPADISRAHKNAHPFYNIYKRIYRLPRALYLIPEVILDCLWHHYYLSWPIRKSYSVMRRLKCLR